MKKLKYSLLGSHCEFRNGLNYKATSNGTSIKMIGVGDFQRHRTINASAVEKTTVDFVPKESLLQDGDLVFVRSNGNKDLVGRSVLVSTNGERVSHSGFTIRARVDRSAFDPEFLSYVFGTELVRRQYHRLGAGSYISNLSQDILEQVDVPCPDLAEQRVISIRLNTAERLELKTQDMLETSKRRRLALMQQLLTGKRRFPGFGKPWKKVAIADVLVEADRPIDMKDEVQYRLASVRRNWGGVFERECLYGRDIKTKNLREIKAGDFLIAHIQAAYGSLALVPPKFDGYMVSSLYTCLRSRSDSQFDLRFFGYLAQQPRMTYMCRVSSNGFFAERLRLNFMPELFVQQPIRIPPTTEEQQAIVKALETADQEIAVLESLLAAYQRQKRALMQQLLTGKRRVHAPAR